MLYVQVYLRMLTWTRHFAHQKFTLDARFRLRAGISSQCNCLEKNTIRQAVWQHCIIQSQIDE
jgi:hypothetical protein